MPWMPTSDSASFTSSSLNGLMIASTFFISHSIHSGGIRPLRGHPSLSFGGRLSKRHDAGALWEYRSPRFGNVSVSGPHISRLPAFGPATECLLRPDSRHKLAQLRRSEVSAAQFGASGAFDLSPKLRGSARCTSGPAPI